MRVCPGCRKSYPAEKTTCDQDGLPLLDISHTFAETGSENDQRRSADGLDRLLTPGMMVGEYVVERMLAEGGMGNIYAGVHPLISKRVAVKVLSGRFAGSARAVARFVLEARSVNQIGHHNIVDIFSIGELDDGRNYLVMELLDGLPMHEMLQRVERFKPGEVLPLYEQLCDALEATHEKGFVHRDLKPDNIVVLRRPPFPFIKILDFGITKLRSRKAQEQTEIGTVLGTPEYMAPEQCRGDEIDSRADIYALGVMLYEFLTGQKPFSDPNPLRILALQMRQPPKPPSALAPISTELEEVVLKAMEKEREKRFGSARELFDALEQVIARRLTWRFNLDAEPRGRPLADQVLTLPPEEHREGVSSDATPTPPPLALAITPPSSAGSLARAPTEPRNFESEAKLQPHATDGRPVDDNFATNFTLPPPGRELGPSRTLPMPFGQGLAPEDAFDTPPHHELDMMAKTAVDTKQASTMTERDEENAKSTIVAPMIITDTEETPIPLSETQPLAHADQPAIAFAATSYAASYETKDGSADQEVLGGSKGGPPSGSLDARDDEDLDATTPLAAIESDVMISEDEQTELIRNGRPLIDPRLLETQRIHQRALIFTASALMMVVFILSVIVVLS